MTRVLDTRCGHSIPDVSRNPAGPRPRRTARAKCWIRCRRLPYFPCAMLVAIFNRQFLEARTSARCRFGHKAGHSSVRPSSRAGGFYARNRTGPSARQCANARHLKPCQAYSYLDGLLGSLDGNAVHNNSRRSSRSTSIHWGYCLSVHTKERVPSNKHSFLPPLTGADVVIAPAGSDNIITLPWP